MRILLDTKEKYVRKVTIAYKLVKLISDSNKFMNNLWKWSEDFRALNIDTIPNLLTICKKGKVEFYNLVRVICFIKILSNNHLKLLYRH